MKLLTALATIAILIAPSQVQAQSTTDYDRVMCVKTFDVVNDLIPALDDVEVESQVISTCSTNPIATMNIFASTLEQKVPNNKHADEVIQIIRSLRSNESSVLIPTH